MDTLPYIKFFIKISALGVNLLQCHIDTLPAGRGRKNRDTFVSGKMGCPQCSPQPISRWLSAPDQQLASHQGKQSLPCIITLAIATGSSGKQKIHHAASFHGNLGLPTMNITLPQSSLVSSNLKSLRVVSPLEGRGRTLPSFKAFRYFPVLVESLTLKIQRETQCTGMIEMLI